MRINRSVLVLVLLAFVTAACGPNITDICHTDTRCLGKKLTGMIYSRAEGYRKGEGVQKDPVKAVQLHRQAAERGHLGSQYWLAESYRTGVGVEKDPAKAVRLHRKAAENGHLGAQYWLAESYRTGEGVEKDVAKAA